MNKTKTKLGRNDPCPCGSGRKYKMCCLHKYRDARLNELTRTATKHRKPISINPITPFDYQALKTATDIVRKLKNGDINTNQNV